MNKDSDVDSVDFANTNETLANETNRLLCELNRAIDHSSALRDIIRRQEALQELESITGISGKSQSLREEIAQLEQQLSDALNGNEVASDPS
ncbi:hypothetical protein N8198_04380 [Gammaproteobacteria bacterium]|nr:hypothetical protein [Gammaproteobacteria bacterium]